MASRWVLYSELFKPGACFLQVSASPGLKRTRLRTKTKEPLKMNLKLLNRFVSIDV